MSLIETIKYSFFGRSSYRQIVYFQSGDATVTFYILVGDKVVSQSFPSIEKAHEYMRYYKISGQVIDEQILQELRQPQEQPRDRSRYSLIKRPYPVGSARVPVAHPSRAPNNVRQYQPIRNTPFRPHFVRKKKVIQ